jgi:hypothetical protein
MTSYETDCPCGKVIAVQAADAGGTVRCACGRQSVVPALSKLRRLDPPPQRPAPPPADYAFLRLPGVITAVVGLLFGCVSGLALGADSDAVPSRVLATMTGWVAQVVGVALVCVSKRFPVFVCVLLPPFGCFGLVAALLIPERLPPVPPPSD